MCRHPKPSRPDGVSPRSVADGRGVFEWIATRLHLWPERRRLDDAGGSYDHYGFRVPAVVVSPRARPDFVSSTIYDHTSVLKLIEDKWNLPSLTRRDAAATAPWEMLDLDGPGAFFRPPGLPTPARPHAWREPGPQRRTSA
jgi:Phosphoesterase family